jgi:hypothetical protein
MTRNVLNAPKMLAFAILHFFFKEEWTSGQLRALRLGMGGIKNAHYLKD